MPLASCLHLLSCYLSQAALILSYSSLPWGNFYRILRSSVAAVTPGHSNQYLCPVCVCVCGGGGGGGLQRREWSKHVPLFCAALRMAWYVFTFSRYLFTWPIWFTSIFAFYSDSWSITGGWSWRKCDANLIVWSNCITPQCVPCCFKNNKTPKWKRLPWHAFTWNWQNCEWWR